MMRLVWHIHLRPVFGCVNIDRCREICVFRRCFAFISTVRARCLAEAALTRQLRRADAAALREAVARSLPEMNAVA